MTFLNLRRGGSSTLSSGARVEQVDEPLTTVIFEFAAYPEAKAPLNMIKRDNCIVDIFQIRFDCAPSLLAQGLGPAMEYEF